MAKQNDIEKKDTPATDKTATAEKNEEKAVRETTEKAARNAATPKAGNKTPQERAGEEILAQYPDEPKVYVTSNGFGFFRESEARNHAATLQDKTVITVKRK